MTDGLTDDSHDNSSIVTKVRSSENNVVICVWTCVGVSAVAAAGTYRHCRCMRWQTSGRYNCSLMLNWPDHPSRVCVTVTWLRFASSYPLGARTPGSQHTDVIVTSDHTRGRAIMQSSSTAMTDLPDLCRRDPLPGPPTTHSAVRHPDKTTCVAQTPDDWSATQSSKSLSSSVDNDVTNSDERCGWGPVQPRCCQIFRNPKVVLFFLCCLATIQVTTSSSSYADFSSWRKFFV